jgi:hypothetical protein
MDEEGEEGERDETISTTGQVNTTTTTPQQQHKTTRGSTQDQHSTHWWITTLPMTREKQDQSH